MLQLAGAQVIVTSNCVSIGAKSLSLSDLTSPARCQEGGLLTLPLKKNTESVFAMNYVVWTSAHPSFVDYVNIWLLNKEAFSVKLKLKLD